ncbi:EamA family transporter [Sporolactobacillus shoreicorticis]|uniref:EamA family transporter n=1 Tax=Sporolactobacillus shoreicorticis TaxID=1923877 RepID=A0ABW5S006_9BACL
MALAPVFTGILSTLFMNERFNVLGWLGTLICFMGVALISSCVNFYKYGWGFSV